MSDWARKELRANFARASRAGRTAAKAEPRAARALYQPGNDSLRIELTAIGEGPLVQARLRFGPLPGAKNHCLADLGNRECGAIVLQKAQHTTIGDRIQRTGKRKRLHQQVLGCPRLFGPLRRPADFRV